MSDFQRKVQVGKDQEKAQSEKVFKHYCFQRKLQEGKRSQGGQKKRYKDTPKASLKDFDIPMGPWEQTAEEGSKWRGLSDKEAALYEKRESVKLNESAENAKPMAMGHQRTHQHTRTYSRNNDGLFHQ